MKGCGSGQLVSQHGVGAMVLVSHVTWRVDTEELELVSSKKRLRLRMSQNWFEAVGGELEPSCEAVGLVAVHLRRIHYACVRQMI